MDLHVWALADVTWMVARTAEEAQAMWATECGERLEDYPELECKQIPDDKLLKVYGEDRSLPPEEHSARIWAALNGPGFLASTEY